MPLPSAKHGLIGLKQRAELLGGTFEAGPTNAAGWRVALRVPLKAMS
jgi:signal transduction histidine kinase